MTSIVIRDLNESKELDREAMRKVVGGRSGTRMTQGIGYRSALTPRTTPAEGLRDLFSFRLGAR